MERPRIYARGSIVDGGWCSGNTTGFDPVILGSIPSPPAI